MKQIILILIAIFFIFCFHFYTTRKIESFRMNIENFDSQCPDLNVVKNYVQQYLPEGDSWEKIMKEVSISTSNSRDNQEQDNFRECLSTDGWTEDCIEGNIDNQNIRAPSKCNKRVEFNCESSNDCKWFYGFCENKNFKQQIEDPFAFRTRNWWQNRISGYPSMQYNYNKDSFIKASAFPDTLKNDTGLNNSDIQIYYNKVFADLMHIINNPSINTDSRKQARKYLIQLREKMNYTNNMQKKSANMSNPSSPIFGDKQLCNKNLTRDCFFSDKKNIFIDKMGNVWYKEKDENYIYWDKVLGGANSTDSSGVCANGGKK